MVATLGASYHMPAERLCPADFNRRHDLELREADMSRIGLAATHGLEHERCQRSPAWAGAPGLTSPWPLETLCED